MWVAYRHPLFLEFIMNIITFTGKTCSGKSTIVNGLIENYPELYDVVVSHTTREPRKGERNGVDYYFIDESEFNNISFIEEIRFNGFRYGVSLSEINRVSASGKTALLIVEPTGLDQIREVQEQFNIGCYSFFINVPQDILLQRLIKTRSEAEVQRRTKSITVVEKDWLLESKPDEVLQNSSSESILSYVHLKIQKII